MVSSARAAVPFMTLPAWVAAARGCGFDIEPIFRDAGIVIDLVHLEDARVAPKQIQSAMVACVAAAKHGHFPFELGRSFAFDYLPELRTFVKTSATLREALRTFGWVRGLINPRIGVELDERDEQAFLAFAFAGEPAERAVEPYFCESLVAAIQSTSALLFDSAGVLERIWFRYPAPGYAAVYAEYLTAPVAFAQPQHGLGFARALLDAPLDGSFPLLHRQAEARLTQRFERVARAPGIGARLQDAFAKDPALLGQSITVVAERLGLSPRTIQRRLRAEGDQFQQQQARAQMTLASAWLTDGALDIETIGERLGFSDRRSFTRAFKRWSGMSPLAYRQRARSTP